MSKGIDFVGFRVFYYFKLPRKRNIKIIRNKITSLNRNEISYDNFLKSFNGWYGHAKWANSENLSVSLIKSVDI